MWKLRVFVRNPFGTCRLVKLKDKKNCYYKENCYDISRKSEGFKFDGIYGNFQVYVTLSMAHCLDFIGLNFVVDDLT